ncbi:Peroxisomal leader peptide-processing protease [Branchiostoma belcheri]|nr:Peroxisomal leader peptide-processing protease [Branchiostoma belcheri]
MFQDACIVSVSCGGSNKAGSADNLGNVTGHSCSGVIVNRHRGVVLSHGIAFSPYMPDGFTSHQVRQQGWYRPQNTDRFHIEVIVRSTSGIVQPEASRQYQPRIQQPIPAAALAGGKLAPHLESPPERKCSADLLLLWRCTDFDDAVRKLMPKYDGWHFDEPPNNPADNRRDTSQQIETVQSRVKTDLLAEVSLSWFALLQLEDSGRGAETSVVVTGEQARIGSPVVAVGTPFGVLCPSVFMNSLVRGIVCNTAGKDGALILTDARCLPGTEGGPLLTADRDGKWLLLGLVAAPLCWKANEWIGLSLVCSFRGALDSLSRVMPWPLLTAATVPHSSPESPHPALSQVEKSVVMVEAGDMWGSGVIVHVDQSKVYLLTCRHVVGPSSRVNVVPHHAHKVRVTGCVVYATPSESVYDLAVVEFPNPGVELVPVRDTRRYNQGEQCFAVGYALFGQNQQLKPTVTAGVLSNVVTWEGNPIMLQSTCAVHAGVSGGALFDQQGQLMGIVVSNAKDAVSKLRDHQCDDSLRLISKLEYYGIQGPTLNWLKAFLTNREQTVVVEGKASAPVKVASGVPQGTVLGPLLFLLYINDLPDQLDSNVRLFADDCLLYVELSTQTDSQLLQKDLNTLEEWQSKWLMQFNPEKCYIMHITNKRTPHATSYQFCGQALATTKIHPYLGVTLTSGLKWVVPAPALGVLAKSAAPGMSNSEDSRTNLEMKRGSSETVGDVQNGFEKQGFDPINCCGVTTRPGHEKGELLSASHGFSVTIVVMVKSSSPASPVNQSGTYQLCMSRGAGNTSVQSVQNEEGELEWSKSLRGVLLGAYYYGYIITQVVGGVLEQKLGGKLVYGTGLLATAGLNSLGPVASRASPWAMFAVRFMMGLFSGVLHPAMYGVWGRWAPPTERSKLLALCAIGLPTGSMINYPLASFLAAELGWETIFYVPGVFITFWLVAWLLLAYDSPSKHPRILEEEQKYIEDSIGDNVPQKPRVPWLKVFSSVPVWALIIGQLASDWSKYFLLTQLPNYMKNVLGFNIKTNGLLSALPYFLAMISILASSVAADRLIEGGKFPKVWIRRGCAITGDVVFPYLTSALTQLEQLPTLHDIVGQCYPLYCEYRYGFLHTGFSGMVICGVILANLSGCNPVAAVALLCLSEAFNGLTTAGMRVVHVEFAPRFSGVTFALANTAGNLPGIFAPLLVGFITENDPTLAAWTKIFYIGAAIQGVGGIFTVVFMSTDVQPWARKEGDQEPNITEKVTELAHSKDLIIANEHAQPDISTQNINMFVTKL